MDFRCNKTRNKFKKTTVKNFAGVLEMIINVVVDLKVQLTPKIFFRLIKSP